MYYEYEENIIKNNGNRPPRTANKPIRSDRNIAKNKNSKISYIISTNSTLNHHHQINKPPTPIIQHPSPKPLIHPRFCTNYMQDNEDNKSNEWGNDTDDDSLPEIPKEWKLSKYN